MARNLVNRLALMPLALILTPAVVVVVTPLSACTTEPAEPTYTWHHDIAPIIEKRCANCHLADGIGPFSLTDYASVKKVGSLVKAQVGSRAMPPWGASSHRKYRFSPALTDAQVKAVTTWVDEGMAEGATTDTPAKVEDTSPVLSRSDLTVKMPVVYTPKKEPDDYRCFLLDWPLKEKKFVTGFAAQPGNTAVVHHIAAYLVNLGNGVDETTLNELQKLDDKEDGPGYTCFGGPTGDSGLLIPIQQLAQWVPGARGTDFPEGTGIEVRPGAKIVLQIHYNTLTAGAQPDQTSIEMRVDDTVKYPAAFAPWLNVVWPTSPSSMLIPAGKQLVTHSHVGKPIGFFKQFVGDLDLSGGFDVHSILLHMHQLGTHAEVKVKHPDGTETVLLNIPRYDFNWQRVYWLDESVRVGKDDELSVVCNWDNSAGNQPLVDGKQKTPTDVTWGEGTHEEMCVANLYVSQL